MGKINGGGCPVGRCIDGGCMGKLGEATGFEITDNKSTGVSINGAALDSAGDGAGGGADVLKVLLGEGLLVILASFLKVSVFSQLSILECPAILGALTSVSSRFWETEVCLNGTVCSIANGTVCSGVVCSEIAGIDSEGSKAEKILPSVNGAGSIRVFLCRRGECTGGTGTGASTPLEISVENSWAASMAEPAGSVIDSLTGPVTVCGVDTAVTSVKSVFSDVVNGRGSKTAGSGKRVGGD